MSPALQTDSRYSSCCEKSRQKSGPTLVSKSQAPVVSDIQLLPAVFESNRCLCTLAAAESDNTSELKSEKGRLPLNYLCTREHVRKHGQVSLAFWTMQLEQQLQACFQGRA